MTQDARQTIVTKVAVCKDCDEVVQGEADLHCPKCDKDLVADGWFESYE